MIEGYIYLYVYSFRNNTHNTHKLTSHNTRPRRCFFTITYHVLFYVEGRIKNRKHKGESLLFIEYNKQRPRPTMEAFTGIVPDGGLLERPEQQVGSPSIHHFLCCVSVINRPRARLNEEAWRGVGGEKRKPKHKSAQNKDHMTSSTRARAT